MILYYALIFSHVVASNTVMMSQIRSCIEYLTQTCAHFVVKIGEKN